MDRAAELQAGQRLTVATIGPREDAAIDECIASTPATSDDTADGASAPAAAMSLREAWWAMLAELDERHGDVDAYNQCLSEADLAHVPEPVRSADEAHTVLSAFAPAGDKVRSTPQQPLAANEDWQRLLIAEGEIEQADWGCRQEIYSDHLGELEAAVTDFEAKRETQIAAAEAEWPQIVRKAEVLGFTGEPGPVGP